DVAEEPNRHRFLLLASAFDDRECLIETRSGFVQIARAQAHLDARWLALDGEARRTCHHGRERLRATHAAETRGEDPFAGEIPAVVLAAHLDERFIRALDDALRSDIDPGARGHLAEHCKATLVELVEVLPRRPARYEVRIGDEHARRVRVSAE